MLPLFDERFALALLDGLQVILVTLVLGQQLLFEAWVDELVFRRLYSAQFRTNRRGKRWYTGLTGE